MEFNKNLWDTPVSARSPGRQRRRGNYEYGQYDPFEVGATVMSRCFSIYLFGPIMDVRQFTDAIEVFDAANENDLVEIHLSTPGGNMDATDTFLQAMHNCEGRVVIHASGGCHSCGSIILMHASEFTLSQNFNMLIHNGSLGGDGDLNKFAAQSKYGVEYMTKVMRETYEGFLTPEELQAMIDGKDFWIGGEEFMRRWGVRQELFKTRLKQQGLLVPDEEPTAEVKPAARRKKKPTEAK